MAAGASDFRVALRALRRAPGVTAAVILSLALGIGAATATGSIVDTILFQPLPFIDGDRLVRVVENFPHAVPGRPALQRGVTHQEFLDWRARARTIADATAVIPIAQRMVTTPDGAAGLWGAMTSANTFALLGTNAILGRTLGGDDDSRPDVAVLSFDTWRRHFSADPAIVGKPLELRAGALMAAIPVRLLTVVGVLPEDFEFPTGPFDFYTPIVLNPARPSPSVTMIARLTAGVTVDAAIQEVNALGAAIRPPWPPTAPPLTVPRFEVQPLKEQSVRTVRPALRILLAAVAVVLLVACANVAGLLVARGIARQREVAMRLALGAGRGRIVRQVLVECLVLAAAGGAAGALTGAAAIVSVRQLTTVDAPGIFRLMFGSTILPRGHEVGVGFRAFAIAFAIAALTSVVFGCVPALLASRTDHLHVVGSRLDGSGRGGARIRAALSIAQLAMATALLVGAGLLAHSFIKLSAADRGYDPSNVLAVQLLFPDHYSMARKAAVIDALLTALGSTPGVRSVGFSRHGAHIGEELMIGNFVPPRRTLEEMRNERPRVRSVSAGFLTAMGVPVLDGREFGQADGALAPPVVVVNRTAARRYFGGDSPVGQIVDWHIGTTSTQVTIVGVVADMRQKSATDEPYPEVFVEYRQFMRLLDNARELAPRQNEWAIGFLSFAVRTDGDPAAAVPTVRRIVREVDPAIGIDGIVPLRRLVVSSIARERLYAVTLSAFAVVAAAMAAIGVYGVLAFAVVRRTREIGIRMALGARRGQVLNLIMRQGAVVIAAGIGLGMMVAVASTRLLEGLLFGITPLDATTFVAVALLFTLVAIAASYLPARRAATVDPAVTLRAE